MAPDQLPGPEPERTRRAHIVELAVAQELGPHIVAQAHPAKQAQQQQQQAHAGLEQRREDDQQVELGQRAPDLDQPLQQQIGAAAEIALDCTGGQPQQHAGGGQRKREQHRESKAVQQAREQVAAAVVGAEPVVGRGRRRMRLAREIVDRGMVITVRRPQHPVARLSELALDEGVEVVGRSREIAAEGRLGQVLQHRRIPMPLIAQQQRPVVRDQLGAQAQHHQQREQPQAEPAQAVGTKTAPGQAPGAGRRSAIGSHLISRT